MKEITLKIPDKKLDFFLELVEQLGLEVAEEHRSIVRERIKNSNPEDMINWEEAKKQVKV